MIQYSQTGLHITVKLDNRVAGHIYHRKGAGFYYVPKGQSKTKKGYTHFASLDDLKRSLEIK